MAKEDFAVLMQYANELEQDKIRAIQDLDKMLDRRLGELRSELGRIGNFLEASGGSSLTHLSHEEEDELLEEPAHVPSGPAHETPVALGLDLSQIGQRHHARIIEIAIISRELDLEYHVQGSTVAFDNQALQAYDARHGTNHFQS